MAVKTWNGTGPASTAANWSGGTLPVQATAGVAGDSIIIATGTCTLDGAYWWGDDTATAIQVQGSSTLAWSRTVNSSLTCCGQFSTNAQTATVDLGTAASPIPSGITATMVLNHSVAMVNYKWGANVELGKITAHGFYRRRNTTLTAAIASTATSCNVANGTGWAVGDTVVFAGTGAYNQNEVRVLTSVTPGVGTEAALGWTTGLTNAHDLGCPVGNFTSNVTFTHYNTAQPGYLDTLIPNAANTAGLRHFENVLFVGAGLPGTFAGKYAMLQISQVTITLGTNRDYYDPTRSCAFFATAGPSVSGTQLLVGATFVKTVLEDIAFYSTVSSASSIATGPEASSGAVALNGTDIVVYRCEGSPVINASGAVLFNDVQLTGFKVFGMSGTAVFNMNQVNLRLVNPVIGPCQTSTVFGLAVFGIVGQTEVSGGDIGYTYGAGVMTRLIDALGQAKSFGKIVLTSTYVNAAISDGVNIAGSGVIVINSAKNADPTSQTITDLYGTRTYNADSYSVDTPPTGSWQFSPTSTTFAEADSIDVFGQGGQVCGLAGFYKLSSPAPTSITLTMSGSGLTADVVLTLSVAAATGVWLPFIITAVPVVSGSGFTLLNCDISVKGSAGSYVRFDEVQQVFAQFNPGAIAFFRQGRPVLGARTLAPDLRYQPLAALSFPAGSVGEALKKLNSGVDANVVKVTGITVIGVGSDANPWGPAP